MAEAAVVCGNPECDIATSGKCVEGLTPIECPHYGKAAPIQPASTSAARSDLVSLPSAARLTLDLAGTMRRANDTRVAAVVGPTDSGKTSLIASVYDLFQSGPVGGYSFARTQTFHAFEEACHKARAASRRTEPGIPRTPVSAVAFYHLQLSRQDLAFFDLLLADRAGEDYRAVADNPSASETFVEIHRADTITVLVDGARLVDSTARHNVRSEVIMILQGLVDGQAVRPAQRIALVLTKTDEVEVSGHSPRVYADFESTVQQVRSLFGFNSLESHRVAASPKVVAPGIERGFGVPALLAFWTSPHIAPHAVERVPTSPRAFGRLGLLG